MIKRFYEFRYRGEGMSTDRPLLIYAGDEMEAREKLQKRLREDFGRNGFEILPRLRTWDNDTQCNNNTRAGLFGGLSPADVIEYLHDKRDELPATIKEARVPLDCECLARLQTLKHDEERLAALDEEKKPVEPPPFNRFDPNNKRNTAYLRELRKTDSPMLQRAKELLQA